jgi:hypothetical protein
MRFVETSIFTAEAKRLLPDEEYQALQVALLLRPTQGPVIPRSGGLRKLRWARPGTGRRGGLRVIYYWYEGDEVFLMLLVYAKNAQEDLTPAQTKVLRRLVEEELQ